MRFAQFLGKGRLDPFAHTRAPPAGPVTARPWTWGWPRYLLQKQARTAVLAWSVASCGRRSRGGLRRRGRASSTRQTYSAPWALGRCAQTAMCRNTHSPVSAVPLACVHDCSVAQNRHGEHAWCHLPLNTSTTQPQQRVSLDDPGLSPSPRSGTNSGTHSSTSR